MEVIDLISSDEDNETESADIFLTSTGSNSNKRKRDDAEDGVRVVFPRNGSAAAVATTGNPSKSADDDNDDDIIEISNPRDNQSSAAPGNGAPASSKIVDGDDEVGIVGSLPVVSRFPHSRNNCLIHPFKNMSKDFRMRKFCEKCYCYVCDVKISECNQWNSHCQAHDDAGHWKAMRRRKQGTSNSSGAGTSLLSASLQNRLNQIISAHSAAPAILNHRKIKSTPSRQWAVAGAVVLVEDVFYDFEANEFVARIFIPVRTPVFHRYRTNGGDVTCSVRELRAVNDVLRAPDACIRGLKYTVTVKRNGRSTSTRKPTLWSKVERCQYGNSHYITGQGIAPPVATLPSSSSAVTSTCDVRLRFRFGIVGGSSSQRGVYHWPKKNMDARKCFVFTSKCATTSAKAFSDVLQNVTCFRDFAKMLRSSRLTRYSASEELNRPLRLRSVSVQCSDGERRVDRERLLDRIVRKWVCRKQDTTGNIDSVESLFPWEQFRAREVMHLLMQCDLVRRSSSFQPIFATVKIDGLGDRTGGHIEGIATVIFRVRPGIGISTENLSVECKQNQHLLFELLFPRNRDGHDKLWSQIDRHDNVNYGFNACRHFPAYRHSFDESSSALLTSTSCYERMISRHGSDTAAPHALDLVTGAASLDIAFDERIQSDLRRALSTKLKIPGLETPVIFSSAALSTLAHLLIWAARRSLDNVGALRLNETWVQDSDDESSTDEEDMNVEDDDHSKSHGERTTSRRVDSTPSSSILSSRTDIAYFDESIVDVLFAHVCKALKELLGDVLKTKSFSKLSRCFVNVELCLAAILSDKELRHVFIPLIEGMTSMDGALSNSLRRHLVNRTTNEEKFLADAIVEKAARARTVSNTEAVRTVKDATYFRHVSLLRHEVDNPANGAQAASKSTENESSSSDGGGTNSQDEDSCTYTMVRMIRQLAVKIFGADIARIHFYRLTLSGLVNTSSSSADKTLRAVRQRIEWQVWACARFLAKQSVRGVTSRCLEEPEFPWKWSTPPPPLHAVRGVQLKLHKYLKQNLWCETANMRSEEVDTAVLKAFLWLHAWLALVEKAERVAAKHVRRQLVGDQTTSEKFSGLLRSHLNNGTTIVPAPQPDDMREITMRDYQKQALRFMLSKEHAPNGISGEFWANIRSIDSANHGEIMYSPFLHCFALRSDVEPAEGSSCGGMVTYAINRNPQLCDEMGLGKTISTVALILSNPAPSNWLVPPNQKFPVRTRGHFYELVKTRATLVVCAVSLVGQWVKEAKRLCGSGVKIYSYYGQKRKRDPVRLADNDIVVTTYHTIAADVFRVSRRRSAASSSASTSTTTPTSVVTNVSQGAGSFDRSKFDEPDVTFPSKSPCHQLLWHRVVIDEGHIMKNLASKISRSTRALRSRLRWLVTGTPLSTSIKDLYGMLYSLRIYGLHHRAIFDKTIAEPAEMYLLNKRPTRKRGERSASKLFPPALSILLSKLMIRHDKKQLFGNPPRKLLELPPKITKRVMVEWGTDTAAIATKSRYDTLETTNLALVANALSSESKCKRSHMQLYQALERLLCFCSCGYVDDTEETSPSRYSETTFPKIRAAVETLVNIRRRDDTSKFLIFSRFTRTLDAFKRVFQSRRIKYATLDGSMTQGKRHKQLMLFENDASTQVFLLSTRAGAVGINLTKANHVFLMEPFWNHALEKQAVGRAWRLGQKRTVKVHRFVMTSSADSRLVIFDSGLVESDSAAAASSSSGTEGGGATNEKDVATKGNGETTTKDENDEAATDDISTSQAYARWLAVFGKSDVAASAPTAAASASDASTSPNDGPDNREATEAATKTCAHQAPSEPLGTPDENAWRESVMNDKSKDNWCLYTLKGKKKRRIVLSGKGPGGLKEFNEALKEDQIHFGGFRVTGVDRKGACTSVRSKFVFVTWVGPKVSVMRRAGVPSLSVAIGKYFEGRHLDLKAMGDASDLNAAAIEKQLRAGILAIRVTDPVRQGDGMQSYVSYKVVHKGLQVVRRYSDFVWLHEQLSKEFVGYLIPPLPEKRQMGRFEPSFIEVRRRYLQKFLRRIAAHPALHKSQDFRDFIAASERELAAIKSSKATSRAKGLLSWFSESVSAVTQSLGSVDLPKTAADAVFDDHCNYVNALLPQLERVHKHLRGLLKHQKEYADSLFQFGLAFTLLGQSETDKLGGSLSQLGHTADRLSQISQDHVISEANVFADPLKDYIALTKAVQAMLDKRREKYAAYQASVAEHRRAESTLGDLKNQGRINMSRIHAAENAVAQSDVKMKKEKEILDAVDERVNAEMEQFKSQKLVDFRKIVLAYVQQQVEYQRRAEDVWKKLIPELDKLQEEEPEPVPSKSP
eukprot:g2215.t1